MVAVSCCQHHPRGPDLRQEVLGIYDLTGSFWAGLTERVDPNRRSPLMARRKNWSAEQIVAKLRQIEVQLAQGKGLALA